MAIVSHSLASSTSNSLDLARNVHFSLSAFNSAVANTAAEIAERFVQWSVTLIIWIWASVVVVFGFLLVCVGLVVSDLFLLICYFALQCLYLALHILKLLLHLCSCHCCCWLKRGYYQVY